MITLLTAAICLMTACSDDITAGRVTDEGQTAATLNVDYTEPISDGNRIVYEMNLYDFTSEGTLASATEALDKLDRLGVDIVWLMPIYDRGDQGKIGSLGSPYAVKDYKSVNPDFGTLTDLQQFVSKAHTLGMKIWLDWVPNHTAKDNTWTTTHPEYYAHDAEGNFLSPANYSDVYQLDYTCEALQQAMVDAMQYWQDNADIDGFRCDYVSSAAIPADFWTRAITQLKEHKPGTEMLGEADFCDPSAKRLFGCGFDFDYAWAFNTDLKDIGTTAEGITLRDDCKALYYNTNYNDMDRMVYLTNHDDAETGHYYLDVMGDNVYAYTVVMFTIYGIPLIYNGQEIGYPEKMSLYEREPISWDKPDVKMQNTIRTLITLKHTQPALANGKKDERGNIQFLNTSLARVMAFKRVKNGNEVLVIVNLGKAGEVKISGLTDGDYTKYLDSQTVTDNITTTTSHLYNETTFNMADHGYCIYVLNR